MHKIIHVEGQIQETNMEIDSTAKHVCQSEKTQLL